MATGLASIALLPGDAVTCTYTNTQNASLDIEKQSVGGTATFDYAVNGSGLAPFTRDTAVANPTANAPFAFTGLQLGTKDVQETPEPGWTLTNIACTANGAVITIGTGIGGTFAQGATAGFDPGDTTVRAVITGGDAPTCTFTNTQNATLSISKTTEGGDGTFDFTGTGTGVPAAFTIATTGGTGAYAGNPITFGPTPVRHQDGDRDRARRLDADEHRLHRRHGAACSSAPTPTSTPVTRASRCPSMRATASPARSRTPGRSASSSRRSSSTTTAAARPSATSGSPPAPARSPSAPRSRPRPTPSPTPPRPSQVAPGTYTLAELALAGYAPSDWTCSNGDGGAFDAGSVTLAAGDPTVTCSITNDDQPVSLVIQKVVVNDDGGSATVGDFGITTSAGAAHLRRRGRGPGRHLHLHRARPSQVAPGTYNLAELALAGYAPSDWTCTNGDGGAFDAGSVTLAAGDPTVTCSITNDDQPVSLVIREGRRQRRRRQRDRRRLRHHHQRRPLTFGAPVEAPADTFTYTAHDPRRSRPAPTPGRARAGRLRAVRLDLHQRRRRRLRRGQRHPRRGRPDGHLLDHQRRARRVSE